MGATYKTISPQLAEDVQFLLLRIGVPTTVSQLTYVSLKGDRVAFQISVTDTVRFAKLLDGHLHHAGKALAVAHMAALGVDQHSRARKLGSSLPSDVVRAFVNASNVKVRPVFESAGLPRGIMSRAGMKYVGYTNQVRVARAFGSDGLHRLTAVQWVKVSQQETSDEPMFNIRVDGVQNLVVNGVVVEARAADLNCLEEE